MKDSLRNSQGTLSWDIMLSYRRKKYTKEVSFLADLAEEAGLRCWVDIRSIDQTVTLSDEDLRSTLRDAAVKSVSWMKMLLFETMVQVKTKLYSIGASMSISLLGSLYG